MVRLPNSINQLKCDQNVSQELFTDDLSPFYIDSTQSHLLALQSGLDDSHNLTPNSPAPRNSPHYSQPGSPILFQSSSSSQSSAVSTPPLLSDKENIESNHKKRKIEEKEQKRKKRKGVLQTFTPLTQKSSPSEQKSFHESSHSQEKMAFQKKMLFLCNDRYSILDSPPKGRVVVVDIETTGSTLSDEIIQIAAMEVLDGVVSGTQFFSTVATNRTITHESGQIHNITEMILQESPQLKTVLKNLAQFVGDSPIVCHNIRFVYKHLEDSFKMSSLNVDVLTKLLFCTSRYFRKMSPNRSYDIDECCIIYDINATNIRHLNLYGRLTDCFLIAALFCKELKSDLTKRSKEKEKSVPSVVSPKKAKHPVVLPPPISKKLSPIPIVESPPTERQTYPQHPEVDNITDDQRGIMLLFFQNCTGRDLDGYFNRSRSKLRPFVSFDQLLSKFESVPCLGIRNLLHYWKTRKK